MQSGEQNLNQQLEVPCQQQVQNTDIKAKKQCRICLEDEQSGRIIRPCKCSGSVTYAHQKCMIQWITRKQDPRFRIPINCELCQTPFQYKVKKKYQLSLETFLTRANKQKAHFIGFILVIILFLSAIIFISIMVGSYEKSGKFSQYITAYIIKSQNIKIVYICVIFLLIIIMLFLITLFITEYAIKSQVAINDLKNYGQDYRSWKIKVHPKQQPVFNKQVLHLQNPIT